MLGALSLPAQQQPPYYQQPAPYYPGQQQQYPQQPYPSGPNQGQYPQTQNQGQQDYPDRPGQMVARLSVINGDASVRRGDTGDWVAAVLNAPLAPGDSISIPSGGRAELQLDNGNFVRIGGDTEIRISDLEPGRNQIQLARGILTYRTLRESTSQGEISTPGAAIHPLRLSAVRVEIAPDGMTRVIVRHGEAEVSSPRGTEHLRDGGMMLLRGTPDEPEFQTVSAPVRDAWDGFNDQRDSYLSKAQSNRYLSPDIYGGEDLDAYGQWGNDPQYGPVWTPAVPQGWAPYRNGQWVWDGYYGWTWVDYDPWGWAPFHYGSWYLRAGFGWTWFPGPRFGHYWYRPAMVGFFGFGGVGAGIGFGNIGWVALAPFELFRPWYGPGGFVGRYGAAIDVNIVHNVNVLGAYRNAGVAGGVTAVSTADFQRGAFRNQIPVNRSTLQQASLVRGAVPVTPTASNLRFTDRAANLSGPRNEMSNQRFYGRPGAAPAQQTSFGQQQAAMRSAFTGSVRPGGQPGAQNYGRTPAGESGWQRFGSPNAAGSNARPAAPAQSGGWDRFGSPQQGSQRFATPSRPVQVAPPIVQQRQAAPSSNRGSGSPAPSYRSAPAPSRGGGGAGGSHASGGHGGRR